MKRKLPKLMLLMLLTSTAVYAQTVTGKVTAAADGSPLPGVSILIKSTSTGTTTDAEGKYSLIVSNPSGVLVVSFIGFSTMEIPVQNRTMIDIALNEDVAQLNEVVVTALGIE